LGFKDVGWGGGVENDVMGTRERCGPELSIGSAAAALLLHQSPKVFTFIRSFPPQLSSVLFCYTAAEAQVSLSVCFSIIPFGALLFHRLFLYYLVILLLLHSSSAVQILKRERRNCCAGMNTVDT
jgi:hypothetical protein